MMAELVGVIASVLTLFEITGKVAKAAWSLYESIHDAPAQLESLARHLDMIQSSLQLIGTHATKPDLYLASSPAISALPSALASANTILAKLEQSRSKYYCKNGLRYRLSYALLGTVGIEKQLDRLRVIEVDLKLLFIVLCTLVSVRI